MFFWYLACFPDFISDKTELFHVWRCYTLPKRTRILPLHCKMIHDARPFCNTHFRQNICNFSSSLCGHHSQLVIGLRSPTQSSRVCSRTLREIVIGGIYLSDLDQQFYNYLSHKMLCKEGLKQMLDVAVQLAVLEHETEKIIAPNKMR